MIVWLNKSEVNNLREPIYKFDRDLLQGESIHVHRKCKSTGFKKHWHNYFEIICYENCVGTCELNAEQYPIMENCLFLLTPKDFHQITTQDKEDSFSYIISFSEQIIDKALLDGLTNGPIVLYRVSPRMHEQIQALYEAFCEAGPYRERHLHHLFNSLLIDILKKGESISAVSGDIHPYVRESISCMLANSASEFSLDFFARRFGVTPTYFSHLFHEHTGVTFKQYLTTLRIECAKRMLEEQELPIIDIGYECGFHSPSQFARSFKAATKMTPSSYRRSRRNTGT